MLNTEIWGKKNGDTGLYLNILDDNGTWSQDRENWRGVCVREKEGSGEFLVRYNL